MVRRASARGILLIPFRTLMASPSKDSGAFNEGSTLRPFASIRSTSDESESTIASSPRSSISPGLASLSVSFPPRATRFPSGTRTIREMIGAAKSRRPTRPHICGRTRRGGFLLRRQSRRDRMRAKLHELKEELRRRRHSPIPEQGRWLRRVVAGWYNYHAVPTNVAALSTFQHHVGNLWRRALQRRSQRDCATWAKMRGIIDRWLPSPRVLHPWPRIRFAVKYPRWEPDALIGPVRFCAGGAPQ